MIQDGHGKSNKHSRSCDISWLRTFAGSTNTLFLRPSIGGTVGLEITLLQLFIAGPAFRESAICEQLRIPVKDVAPSLELCQDGEDCSETKHLCRRPLVGTSEADTQSRLRDADMLLRISNALISPRCQDSCRVGTRELESIHSTGIVICWKIARCRRYLGPFGRPPRCLLNVKLVHDLGTRLLQLAIRRRVESIDRRMECRSVGFGNSTKGVAYFNTAYNSCTPTLFATIRTVPLLNLPGD